MDLNFLDFEQPIAELEANIEELRHVGTDSEINIQDEIATLEKKSRDLTESIFSNLKPWQISQVARHPLRPYFLDYVKRIFDDFEEMHGDRAYADDQAIVSGIARLEGMPVAIIGHQKGRDTKEKLHRNFGMPRPEGYRKALRIMQTAERFRLPILTFIDTPGAYPGVGAEERGQSEAIARNLLEMAGLKTPILATVIGEGGSGGALALGVGDRVLMFETGQFATLWCELAERIGLKPEFVAGEWGRGVDPAAVEAMLDDIDALLLTGDIAMDGDRGIIEEFPDFSFDLQSTIAKGDKVCRLVISRKTQ